MVAGFVGAVTGIGGTAQTGVTVESSGKLDTTNKGLDTKIDSSVEVKTEVKDTNDSSQRVLPTVNKVDSKDDSSGNSERLLPTVNKKTGAKVQVRGWDPDKKEAILGKIQATLENNPEIKMADVDEDSVEIKYSAPGKFLGLFPMNFNLNVSADSEARVKVKFPWHRFLLKTEFSNTAELLNGVFQHNQTDLEFLKSKASEDRQVEIFITISNSLKIMHEMSKSIIGNIKA